MTDKSTRWSARHFDGETPAPRDVVVGLESGDLIVVGDAMQVRRWPLESVVLVNAGGRDGPVQLELRGERSEGLLVKRTEFLTGAEFLAALRAASGGREVKRVDAAPVALRVVLALTVAAAVFLFLAWRWGVPALAAVAAEKVPASWERELGAAALEDLAPEYRRVDDRVILRPVEDSFTRLVGASNDVRGWYPVLVIRSRDVNAYAVPGGHVVVTTALLRVLDGPEELAAVLAHEITHVTKRHSTRGMLEREGLRLVFGLVSGGDSELRGIVETAGTLGQLSYSRNEETEADVGAAYLLARTGISPLALARVYDHLSAAEGGGPGLEFLSTHPASAARRERALELSRTLHVEPALAPPDTTSWRLMKKGLAGVPDLVRGP
ncbi:MAG TPA: M48 family metallopeptidase [Candidatus Eisenbacteria bacterium]|jgi:predicted Zn-dependent protease|nr:M48 family metallopeptidase [Candidatus Eisenbacteria bacterium]